MIRSALDDPEALAAPGTRTMLALAGELGSQLGEGFRLGRAVPAPPSGEGVRSVVVCGMGGSGVAGDVLRALFADRLPVPVVVVKGYALPEFCGRDSLVIASSFSGDTEETVSAYSEAVSRGCRVVAASSGGELASLAEADQVPHVRLPGGVPMPRAAIGYLTGMALGVLDRIGLIPDAVEDADETARLLEGLPGRLGPEVGLEANEAKQVAAWVGERTPVVWGSSGVAETAALRWKTQFNENAKVPAWSSTLPELDHNEVEGWSSGTGNGHAAVALRHPGEHHRTAARIRATALAVQESGLEVREVHAQGRDPLQWLLSLIMVGDFASIYLAVLRGVDPMPVPVLASLKERLRT